jgi:hypothetical protein
VGLIAGFGRRSFRERDGADGAESRRDFDEAETLIGIEMEDLSLDRGIGIAQFRRGEAFE